MSRKNDIFFGCEIVVVYTGRPFCSNQRVLAGVATAVAPLLRFLYSGAAAALLFESLCRFRLLDFIPRDTRKLATYPLRQTDETRSTRNSTNQRARDFVVFSSVCCCWILGARETRKERKSEKHVFGVATFFRPVCAWGLCYQCVHPLCEKG